MANGSFSATVIESYENKNIILLLDTRMEDVKRGVKITLAAYSDSKTE